MTKVRKQKRNKRYQYNVNRKRMNKKRLPVLTSPVIKNAWNTHKSSQKNFKEMGLVFDVNNDIKSMNSAKSATAKSEGKKEEKTTSVIEELKQYSGNPREKQYQLPKHQTEHLTYLLDKYGNDYKAMAKDKRNYLQQTWKQLRNKIKLLKNSAK